MSFVFYGVYWKTDPKEANIWYSDPKTTNITKKQIKIGEEFNIRILDRKFCIGSENGRGSWITCKQRRLQDDESDVSTSYQLVLSENMDEVNSPGTDVLILPDSKSYKQCYRCSMTEYFTCRMTCVGDVCIPTSDRAKQLCEPANTSIYLTYVGGEFKIGVSLGIPRRWIEQGSDLATVIARAPGLEARRLEQYAARELDLKLQVRSQTKMQYLTTQNLEDPRQKLQNLIDSIKPMISKILSGTKYEIIDDPEIHDFHNIYGGYEITTPIQEFEVVPGAEFGGTIVGIKGNILIVQKGNYHHALNLKQLVSSEFEFLDAPPEIESQSYLDQWF